MNIYNINNSIMVLKLGSKGEEVKELQEFLGLNADGDFGPKTDTAVKEWQKKNGLTPDGIVGPKTLSKMGFLDTDQKKVITEQSSSKLYSKDKYTTSNGLEIVEYFMPKDEYRQGPIKPKWLFIHHTAGWENPYNTIKAWDSDKIGQIGTEFVIGGPSIKGNSNTYDGEVVQAFPHGNYAWHLGANGSQTMHVNSIGIEVCNFGYVVNGKAYQGSTVDPSQIVTLSKPFRGHSDWHRYSDEQIESLRKLILYIGERDGIDVRKGLPELVRQKGADAFEWNADVYYGKLTGLWTHVNTRKDKVDMFPQQELLDMLMSL